MTNSSNRPSKGFNLRRLWWLMALKVVLLAFALYVALRVYNLV